MRWRDETEDDEGRGFTFGIDDPVYNHFQNCLQYEYCPGFYEKTGASDIYPGCIGKGHCDRPGGNRRICGGKPAGENGACHGGPGCGGRAALVRGGSSGFDGENEREAAGVVFS